MHGSKGLVSADNLRATNVEVANGDGYRREPLMNFFMTRYTEAYRNEIGAFIALGRRRQADHADRRGRPEGAASGRGRRQVGQGKACRRDRRLTRRVSPDRFT